jgi:threonine/homoserine/homoserine lactone efflux protein
MELTPGPNMTWLGLLSAREGRRSGLAAVAGIALGLSILGAAATLGAVSAMQAWPALLEAVRWIGVAFMLYLALEAWTGADRSVIETHETVRHFRRGLVLNVLNPKAALVFLTLIPTFAFGGPGDTGGMLMLSAVYVVIATAVHTLIVVFASQFQGWLLNPTRERIVRRIFSLLMATIAVWMALGPR